MESEALVIEESADTLEEAKQLAGSKVPEDHEIVKHEILSEGKPEKISQSARTPEEAQEKALALLPPGARDVQSTLTPEQVINEQVQALDEASARMLPRQLLLSGAELLRVTLLKPPRKQFLMVQAVPGTYNREIKLPAKCEVTYTPKPRVRITARVKSRNRILEMLDSAEGKDEKNRRIRKLLEERKIVDKIGQLTNQRRGGIGFLLWCDCGYPLVPSLLDLEKVNYFDDGGSSFRYHCPHCHKFALEENYD